MEVPLGHTTLFRGLSDTASEDLAAAMDRRSISRGSVIFKKDDHGDSMFVILSGRVRMTRPGTNGQEHLLTVLGGGDLVGELTLFDPKPRMATATAMTAVELAVFDNAAMASWLERCPEGAMHLLRILAQRLRRANDALEGLLHNYVPSRVAIAILDLAERFGTPSERGTVVQHAMTQTELAQYVGASRESVNRTLAELAAAGVISLEPGMVVLHDADRLRERVL